MSAARNRGSTGGRRSVTGGPAATGSRPARRPRRHRWRRSGVALLPLALLPAALATSPVPTASVLPTAADQVQVLPDGTQIPMEEVSLPASVTVPKPGVVVGTDGPPAAGRGGTVRRPAASVNGIPDAALAAYQRAETVIGAADPACRLDWELIAAIGRVESDHGRYGGNRLSDDGVATPGIVGIALDGTNSTTQVVDSDGGSYDGDDTWDRAVGPMQFIPTTWAVVGVDADGDGRRDPQDIDDAALAAAVYLCSGNDDLASDSGRRSAVYRYNHSDSYVGLVLELRESYLSGDYTSVPNSTTAPAVFVPTGPATHAPARGGKGQGGGHGNGNGNGNGTGDGEGGNGDGGPGAGGDDDTRPGGSAGPNSPIVPDAPQPPAGQTLTAAEAAGQCSAEGLVNNPLRTDDDWDQCVADYTG